MGPTSRLGGPAARPVDRMGASSVARRGAARGSHPVHRHARPLLRPAAPQPGVRLAEAGRQAPHPRGRGAHPGTALLGRRLDGRDSLRQRRQVHPRRVRRGDTRPGRGDALAAGLRRSSRASPRHRRRGAPGADRTPARSSSSTWPSPTCAACATSARATTSSTRPGDGASPSCVGTTWWPAWTPGPNATRDVKDLARAFPDTVISLDHAGLPLRRDDEYLALWRRESDEPRRGAQRHRQGLRPGHGRPALDARFAATPGPVLHRHLRRRAHGLRHQLAGRSAVLVLPGCRRRLRRDHQDFSLAEQTAMFSANAERIFRI